MEFKSVASHEKGSQLSITLINKINLHHKLHALTFGPMDTTYLQLRMIISVATIVVVRFISIT